MEQRTRVSIRNASVAVVGAWLAAGFVVSAQSQKFQAERNRLHVEAVAAQKARGIKDENDPQLQKYPPAVFQPVSVRKVLPSGTLSLALAGKFPAGVTILSDRDGAVLTGAVLTGTNYSARMTVGPGEGPGFIKLWAFAPVSLAIVSVPVAFIDTVYRFDLKSSNGITVKAIPTAKTFTIEGKTATLRYQVEFYKPGEAKPFETRVGTMNWYDDDEPRSRLDITLTEQTGSAQAEVEELNKKMADPKLTDAQREALGERLAGAMQRMMDELMKAGADPAAANKKQDDFGCHILQVYPGEAGAARGMTVCGKNFNGGKIETTGTMTRVK